MFSVLFSPAPMEPHYSPDIGYPAHDEHGWLEHSSCPPSVHHTTPLQEYSNFSFSPLHVSRDPFGIDMSYSRPGHPHLQHTVGPTWPSMLTSQSMYMQPILPTIPPQTLPNMSPSKSIKSSQSQLPVPRRTLTDMDRRRMCQYHESHPTKKQTEIGEIFGVERSTVSKVLRHKEKYLSIVEELRSPIKRAKGKFPDIERALTNWARNYQKQGKGLTDDLIKEKLAFFATTVGGSEGHRINNDAWLERFKQKNQLTRPKSRKTSHTVEAKAKGSHNSHSPAASKQSSPQAVAMSATKSDGNIKYDTIESPAYHRPFHSQSNASLSSVFSDSAIPSYSNENASPSSPLFTPESAPLASSPFLPLSTHSHAIRPRSMTLPHLDMETYISPQLTSGDATPKRTSNNLSESPVSDVAPQQLSLQTSQLQPLASAAPQVPPMLTPAIPLPQSLPNGIHSSPTTLSIHTTSRTSPSSGSSSAAQLPPSQYEAHEALKVVMTFLTHAPQGVVVAEPQELLTIGNLMDKLQLHRGSLGGEGIGTAQQMMGQQSQQLEQQQHDFTVHSTPENGSMVSAVRY